MLKELSKLATGLLVQGGYMTPCGTTPMAVHAQAAMATRPDPRTRTLRRRTDAIEWLLLVPIWIATPLIAGLAIASLLRPA